ncbi:MAG: hypothetical protein HKO53_02260 [Gemmatimonadetes bacterium]|nr:hypothetical protein [Gemmatimonadota bacterium]
MMTRPVVALTAVLAIGSPQALSGQNWKTVSASRAAQGEEHLEVSVTYGVGELRLSAGPDDLLYRTRLTFDEDAATPVHEYRDGELHVGISQYRGNALRFKEWSSEGAFDVELSPQVPMDLELEFGAVQADLDFTGLALTSLELETGASESAVHMDEPNVVTMDQASFHVGAADFNISGLGNFNARRISVEAGVGSVTLELGGTWVQESELEIEMGLGSLELRIPRSLGVRLERSSFLTSMDTGGMVRRDGAYYSANWDGAERKIDVEISAAFGSVDIVWIR